MKRLTLFCLMIFAGVYCNAQIIHSDHSLEDTYLNKLTLEGRTTKSYDEIQGSPYLSADFVSGYLMAPDGKEYAEIMMRYNIYADEMEFKDRNGKTLALNKDNDENVIILNKRKFKYFPQNELKCYCEILSDGKLSLLKKYSVIYQKPEAPKAYEQSAPARFISGNEKYFLLKGDGEVEYLAKKKNIVEYLDGFQNPAKEYINDKKLKLNSEEALVQLVDYYNESNK